MHILGKKEIYHSQIEDILGKSCMLVSGSRLILKKFLRKFRMFLSLERN
jgi:hypothetical protein